MKTNIFLLLTVLFAFNAKSQVNKRIITCNTKVITELNEPLIAALDRHLEVIKAEKTKIGNDFFIIVSIFPRIREWQIPKHVFDSIYAINDFETVFPIDSLTPTYSINIILASKKYFTDGWMGFGRKNTYYYKYKNYDVLISSDLNILFKNEGEIQQFVLPLIIEERLKTNKYYGIRTGYAMWNRYLTEIRLKDLIWPPWTGNRDDFR